MVSLSGIKGKVKKGWSVFVATANRTTAKVIQKKGGSAYVSNKGQDVEIPVPENRKDVKISSDITT